MNLTEHAIERSLERSGSTVFAQAILSEEEDLKQADFYDVRYPNRIDSLSGDLVYSPLLELLGVRKGKKLITVVPQSIESMKEVDGKYEKKVESEDEAQGSSENRSTELDLREEVIEDYEVRRFEY